MNPLNILVVDDSPSFRAVLVDTLKADRHAVTVVSTGEESLASFREQQPDIVLISKLASGLGVVDTIREMRKLTTPLWIPILFIATSMADEDIQEAFAAGADEFLLKPLNPLHLQIRLRFLMRMVAMQRSRMAIADALLDGVIRIDVNGIISIFNPAAERMFGYTAAEVVGQNVSLLMPSPDREAHDGYIANYRETGQAKIIGIGRKVIGRRKDGRLFPMHLGITQANTPDGKFFIGLVRDLTTEEELLAQVQHMAHHDALTKLPNRLHCMNYLAERYSIEPGPAAFTLFFCDLDGFKDVNDRCGHAAGDAVLLEAAKRIRGELFVRDFLGRLGGDEFLVVVDGVLSDERAMALGEKIISAMRAPIPTEFGDMSIGASIGYAHSTSFPGSVEALLHAADEAMYQSKRAGKGRVSGAIVA
jgi:diguanylate cyclase (GGDEF)-like protein/PAS domain S-box-containing protein